jgi:hypothetical protein
MIWSLSAVCWSRKDFQSTCARPRVRGLAELLKKLCGITQWVHISTGEYDNCWIKATMSNLDDR